MGSGRTSRSLTVGAGALAAFGALFAVVATAKPKRGSLRFKLKLWLTVKWPLTFRYLTMFDEPLAMDEANAEVSLALQRERSEIVGGVFSPKKRRVNSEDVTIATRDGEEIKVRVYRPPAAASHPLPVVVYIHGGGFVRGSIDSYDTPCHVLAHSGPFVVVSVNYRLAPEHKHPTALHDCQDALRWVAANIAGYGGSAHISIAGDSAGGHLALATSLAACSEGSGMPSPQAQVLVYPMADATNTDSESYTKYATGFACTQAALRWCWGLYLDGSGCERADPTASPALAKVEQYAKLPRTLLVTAEWDPLLDDGLAVLRQLQKAKVDCEHVHYTRNTHGLMSFPTIGAGTDAMVEVVEFLLS